MVETALTMPLLVLLFFGITDLCFMTRQYWTLNSLGKNAYLSSWQLFSSNNDASKVIADTKYLIKKQLGDSGDVDVCFVDQKDNCSSQESKPSGTSFVKFTISHPYKSMLTGTDINIITTTLGPVPM